MGALLNYLHHRQLSFDEKDESYPGVIARDSGCFHHKTQLIDALIDSYDWPYKETAARRWLPVVKLLGSGCFKRISSDPEDRSHRPRPGCILHQLPAVLSRVHIIKMSDSKPPALCVSGRTLTLLVLGCWVLLLSSGCGNSSYRSEMAARELYLDAVDICVTQDNFAKCMKSLGWRVSEDYENDYYTVVED